MRTLLRALRHRAGTTLVILAVALCATAAATVGPTYYSAAKVSILQDTLQRVNVVARGFQAVQQGGVRGALDPLRAELADQVDTILHGAAVTDRLFQRPVSAIETTAFFTDTSENVPFVWRSDLCSHLRFVHGHCPTAVRTVVISSSLASINHWSVGQVVHPAGYPRLTIVGVYVVPDAGADYWFARGATYFPYEQPTAQSAPYDALFTPRRTIETLKGNPQGSTVVSRVLADSRVQPGDLDVLDHLDDRLNNGTALNQVAVITGLSTTIATVHSSWTALSVPVVVVTAELLVLTWLLLFLVVTDSVEARGPEIALAKLRGYGAGRALRFGLGEPVTVLAVALPLGAIVGWAATKALASVLLRSGTPVSLPVLGWAGAAVAAVGGVAAVVVAARATVVRPVVDQWRRTGRRASSRGWLFDAVVLTGTVAGLLQLAVSGTLSSASQSALALLVPGLLGLAVAVVASRLLPLACRALFGRTRRAGGLGPFLAMRHIVRRPGGTRTTMILATAMALATFSICAWSVGAGNRSRVARVVIGAPTVLTVLPPPNVDLPALIDRLDPGGRSATVVESFDNGSSTLVAVQPQRFASVANWSAAGVDRPADVLAGLHPPAPAPLILDGDRVRVRLRLHRLQPPGAPLVVDVVAHNATAPTPIELGPLNHPGETLVRTGELSACPCVLSDLQVGTAVSPVPSKGSLTLLGVDVHGPDGWTRLAGATDPARWVDTQDQQVRIGTDVGGLSWSFFAPRHLSATLRTRDRPDPLPAVVTTAVANGNATFGSNGLDAAPVQLRVQSTTGTLPGAVDRGSIVDLTYAERAAYGNVLPATTQVWVRGDADRIRRGLRAAHVAVASSRTSSGYDDELGRQGPALASVLFLADAAAAAVLAALAAVLSLSAAARRRRYEYAALSATGASARTLYAALAIEQLVVVGFGAIVGAAAGLLSFAIASHSVPQFVTQPVAALLSYQPSAIWLAAAIGGGFVLMLAAAALAAAALLRSVSPEQLREAPS